MIFVMKGVADYTMTVTKKKLFLAKFKIFYALILLF